MGQVAAACNSGVIGRLESAMMQQARRNSNIWWRLEPSGELASKHPICSGHAYFVFSLGRKIEEIQFESSSVAGYQINQSWCGSLVPGMVVPFVQFTPGTALRFSSFFLSFFLSFGFLIYSS
jgi:hypothetical protein